MGDPQSRNAIPVNDGDEATEQPGLDEALRLSDDLPDDPVDRVAQVVRWALKGARDEG